MHIIGNPVFSYTVGGAALCVKCSAGALCWWLVALQQYDSSSPNGLQLVTPLLIWYPFLFSPFLIHSSSSNLNNNSFPITGQVLLTVNVWVDVFASEWDTRQFLAIATYIIAALWLACLPAGRLRTKQTLSTASNMGSSQVDSRGRTRSKMASQSQRKYLQTQIHIVFSLILWESQAVQLHTYILHRCFE